MSEAIEPTVILLPAILILALGIVASVASHILRVSAIIGYLVLGLALSFWLPSSISPGGTTEFLGQLGIAFLLFDIGLHSSLAHVRRDAADIFGFGPVQIVIATAALTLVILTFEQNLSVALLVGATLSTSSTAVVARLVAERRQRTCPVGMTATSILIFQDIFSILLLIVASGLSSGSALPMLGAIVAKAGLAVGLTLLLQRILVRPLFAVLSRHGEQEVFTALALVIAMASGWAASRAGLSMTFGAFLGGMAIAESPFRALVRSEIAPFKGLLTGLFFISVGASIDLLLVVRSWPVILALTLGLVVVKAAANIAASMIFRWSYPGSIQLGFLLAQGSEFAFVILAVPAVRMLVGETLAAAIVVAVAASLALTPIISQYGRTLAGRIRTQRSGIDFAELKARGEVAPVLIIGMGRVGRTIADALTEFGLSYDAVERNGDRLRDAIADGYSAYFGNADDMRFWSAAELGQRRFCIATAPTNETMSELLPVAKQLFPALRQIAVVPDRRSADAARALGAEAIISKGEDAGIEAARYLLGELHADPAKVEAWSAREMAMA